MNKRFLGIAAGIVALLNTGIFAQVSFQPGITAGIGMFSEKTSGNGSTFTTDSKTGIVAGGVLDIVVLNMFSIEPGIVYSMRGGQTSSGAITVKDDKNYLAIPVHAKVRFTATPIVHLYALAGVNLGILLSAKEDNGSTTTDVKDQFNSTAFGLDFGGGLEFSLGGLVPYIEYVYDLGLSNIAKDAPSGSSFTTSGSQIQVGLRFKK
jgi:opacity protein-like surface antigen